MVKKISFVLLLICVFILNLGFASAATRTAASCNYGDVLSQVNSASNGDTINIPSGNCIWNSKLILNKSISIIGAGSSQTIIYNNAGGTLIHIQPSNDLPVRVSGIKFDQHNTEYMYVIVIAGKASSVRIDNCYFETGDWGIAINPFLPSYGGITGPVYGVIDHNTFHNMKRAIEPGDVRASDRGGNDGATAWSEPIEAGSINNIYLEDNNFTYDSAFPISSYTNGGDATIYGNSEGGSVVIRNNNFFGYNGDYLDNHGDVNGANSAKYYEVYNNTFTVGSNGAGGSTYVGNSRGGSWLFWGNKINGYSASGEILRLWNYCAINGHPVNNTYIWGNIVTPGPIVVTSNQHNSLCPSAAEPVINRDYFLRAPTLLSDKFYGYTPLVYPHPLVSGINITTCTNCHYVRAGASGNGNGSDWNNAWTSLSSINWSKITPGSKICIAGGLYNENFLIKKSGTLGNRINIVRASSDDLDCYSANGWISNFDSQVIINSTYSVVQFTDFLGDYVTLDGKKNNGIKIIFQDGGNGIEFNTGADFVELKYLDIVGPGMNYDFKVGARGIDATPWADIGGVWKFDIIKNLTISHCNIHDTETLIQFTNGTIAPVMEYSNLYNSQVDRAACCARAGGCLPNCLHENIIYVGASINDGIFRYNNIYNYSAEGLYFPDKDNNRWKIYGNIFHDSIAGSTGRGIEIGSDTSDIYQDFQIYNNIFANMWGGLLVRSPATGFAYNNIYWNSSAYSFGSLVHDYNFFNDGTIESHSKNSVVNPFVNSSLGNFHIKENSILINNGVSLNSEFSLDLDGNIRGADGLWDIGAYEYNSTYAGKTYYVDKSVTGVSDGLSWSSAYKTIQSAFDSRDLNPGDVIIVAAGNYNETVRPGSDDSGNSSFQVTLKSKPGDLVLLDGKQTIGNAFYLDDVSYFTLDGFYVDNYYWNSIRCNGAGKVGNIIRNMNINIDLTNNLVVTQDRSAIFLGNQINSIVENNIVTTDNGHYDAPEDTDGIKIGYSNNTIIRNNFVTISNNGSDPIAHDDGIQLWNSYNILVDKNYVSLPVYHGYQQGIYVEGYPGTWGNWTISNNIIIGYGGSYLLQPYLRDSTAFANMKVVNNTVVALDKAGSLPFRVSGDNTYFKNNIFVAYKSDTYLIGNFERNTQTALNVNNNLYFQRGAISSSDILAIGIGAGANWLTWQEWQGLGYDALGKYSDPLFVNVNNPLGNDGIPFTSDDGLRPNNNSLACRAGEGFGDIGALACISQTGSNFVYHPADSDLSASISASEMNNYIQSYFSGNYDIKNVLYLLAINQYGGNYNYSNNASVNCSSFPWNCWTSV